MEIDRDFHDKVAALCLKRFETLSKSGKPKQGEWTILSAIVLEFDGSLSVAALGTGSKCVGKSKMSPRGDILNDSHAEVICRRSFLRFILDRMKSNADFLHYDDSSKKFRLCEGVRLHFFTTHAPCGDASIFVKVGHEDFGEIVQAEDSDEDEVPRKIARIGEESDIFRTGAKCLPEDEKQDLKDPGCGYHVLGAVRTKPGRGDPTLSVSCSDKLSRWCHLGIQGALLSLLFERPLYFSTFTIAGNTPFSREALERALYNRLGTVTFKRLYSQVKLVVGQATLPFDLAKALEKRPCDSSISWCDIAEKSLEVAVEGKRQGVTKNNTASARLKICKLEFFRSFVEVCELRRINFEQERDLKTFSYKEVKDLAVDYNECWKSLRESFKVWTNKDVNLLHFSIK